MRKLFTLSAVFLIGIFLIGIASAYDCQDGKTIVGGKVYIEATGDGVGDVNVEVICNSIAKETQTGPLGGYSVFFSQEDCDLGYEVTVNAEKDGLTGTSFGSINRHFGSCCLDLNVGIVHVPLIPEFGLFVGALTILSSVAIFFIIRRR